MDIQDLRDDIYDNLKDGITWTRESKLKEMVEAAQNCLDRFFPTEEDVIRYVNNFEDHEDAEFFLNTCRFYHYSKSESNSSLKFLLYVSTLEKMSNYDYISFQDWLVMNDNEDLIKEELEQMNNFEYKYFKSLIDDLYHQKYVEEYGAHSRFKKLLEDELKEDEKIELIASFDTEKKQTVPGNGPNNPDEYDDIEDYAEFMGFEVDEKLRPSCYSWKRCSSGNPCYSSPNCLLQENEEELKDEFKKTTRILYDYRSDLAHGRRLPPFQDEENVIMRDNYQGEPRIITFHLKNFEEIIEKTLKRYFDTIQS